MRKKIACKEVILEVSAKEEAHIPDALASGHLIGDLGTKEVVCFCFLLCLPNRVMFTNHINWGMFINADIHASDTD